MNISMSVCFCHLRGDDICIIKTFCAFRTIFQHGAHCSVSVNVCIFTLNICFFTRLKGKILINFHKVLIHLTHLCMFSAIQNICFCCFCIAVCNQVLLNSVLNLFNGRNILCCLKCAYNFFCKCI